MDARMPHTFDLYHTSIPFTRQFHVIIESFQAAILISYYNRAYINEKRLVAVESNESILRGDEYWHTEAQGTGEYGKKLPLHRASVGDDPGHSRTTVR